MSKTILLYCMCALYLVAGANHFINAQWYLPIIPQWMPCPTAVNYVAGCCEIIFALLLLPIATRRIAAIFIILLLIAVFPANIQMMTNYRLSHNPLLWLTALRLPVQLVLIGWAWVYARKDS